MPWNPTTYNLFKNKRFEPFFDAIQLIRPDDKHSVIDLGCGTGELTSKLADMIPHALFTGIDSSQEMLEKSKVFEKDNLQFKLRSIEDQLRLSEKFDLVFSNAAIQWTNDHNTLLPDIIKLINSGGQLVIQLPSQHHNITNRLLDQLAMEAPFDDFFNNWDRSTPVLEIDIYAQILFENGGRNIAVFEKIYPIILNNTDALFDWVSGTALIPYIEKLAVKSKNDFIEKYKNLLRLHFMSETVFYPFKRIIMSAEF